MMKAGLVSITFRALSPERIVELVAGAGLEGIEWGGDVHVPHGDLQRASAVRRLTCEAGLAVASYGSYYKFADCESGASARLEPDIESVLDTAEALGAPAVRVWAGTRSPVACPVAVRQKIVDRTREMAELALARGLRIDFEFHENTLTETTTSAVDLLEAVGHPSVRTLWQPILQRPSEQRLAGLRAVLPWVSNVHCNHFAQDPWPEVHALAEGAAEWSAYLDLLGKSEAERWLLIEHVRDHAESSFREDAAALRRWLRAARA